MSEEFTFKVKIRQTVEILFSSDAASFSDAAVDAAKGYRRAGYEIVEVINNETGESLGVDGFCEGCSKPLMEGSNFWSDSEGVLLCGVCFAALDSRVEH